MPIDPKIRAQIQYGVYHSIDVFILLAVVVAIIVGVSLAVASAVMQFSCAQTLVGISIGVAILLQFWLVILAYRIVIFISQLHAEIKLLPVDAARVLLQHTQQSSKPTPR